MSVNLQFDLWFRDQLAAGREIAYEDAKEGWEAATQAKASVSAEWIDYSNTRPTGESRRMLVDSSWGVREAHWVANFQDFQDASTSCDEGMYAESDGEPFVVRFWREHPAPAAPQPPKD